MKPTPIEISCAAVKAKLDAGNDVVLIDCRERDEWDLVRLGQSQLLPMSEIQQRIGELEKHREVEIIIHCHHGARSLQVATWLRQQGFADAKSMAGGIEEWALQIDCNLPRY